MSRNTSGSMTLALDPFDLPSKAPLTAEVFALGDVHGQAETLGSCLKQIAQTPRLPDLKRVIVFLGDLIDRGPDSLGSIELALDARTLAEADSCIILPGNHELMLLEVLGEADPEPWFNNGGETVMKQVDPSWADRPWHEARRRLEAGLPNSFTDIMRDAPSHLRLGDLLFVHAGLNPEREDAAHLDRNQALSDLHWATIRYEALTWSGGWDLDPQTGERTKGPTVVVHGHTPAIRSDLSETAAELEQMESVDEHRAICLDAGASTRPQVGWARFYPDGETVKAQIFATVTPPAHS